MSDEAKNPRRRRWWQFGLRGLLMLVLLVAVGLLVVRVYFQPYWRQKETVALVDQLGGTCKTVEVDHWWLKLLGGGYNVTQVNVADCDDPDAYVAKIAELPAIELLLVGGRAFTDEHAQRLLRLRTLRGLILDCTSISENGLAALREGLPGTDVYVSQRRTIAAARKLLCVVSVDHGAATLQLRQLVDDEWFEEARVILPLGRFDDSDSAILEMLPELVEVELVATEIRDDALRHLKRLNNLTRLELDLTQVSDAGLEHLRSLSQLEYLSFEGTAITDVGLEHLHGLDHLQRLFLRGSRVTATGVAKLQRALPKCSIIGGP